MKLFELLCKRALTEQEQASYEALKYPICLCTIIMPSPMLLTLTWSYGGCEQTIAYHSNVVTAMSYFAVNIIIRLSLHFHIISKHLYLTINIISNILLPSQIESYIFLLLQMMYRIMMVHKPVC